MNLSSSRIVLFLANFFLSFVAFVSFNLPKIIDVIKQLVRGDVPENIELLAFQFYQSTTIFVTGIFFIFFITQFEKISFRLEESADDIPDIVREEITKVTGPIDASFQELTHQLAEGMITRDQQVYRALEYERDTGVLKNHSSADIRAPRNILLNVNTITTIFTRLNSPDSRTLRNVGRKCGSNFLHNFKKLRVEIGSDFQKALDAWIEYDANAGWGKFEVERSDIKDGFCIVLKHNFLMEDEGHFDKNTDLNQFICGYIEGVFSAFPSLMLEKAGINPETFRIVYMPKYSPEGRVLYSPSEGSLFCVQNDLQDKPS